MHAHATVGGHMKRVRACTRICLVAGFCSCSLAWTYALSSQCMHELRAAAACPARPCPVSMGALRVCLHAVTGDECHHAMHACLHEPPTWDCMRGRAAVQPPTRPHVPCQWMHHHGHLTACPPPHTCTHTMSQRDSVTCTVLRPQCLPCTRRGLLCEAGSKGRAGRCKRCLPACKSCARHQHQHPLYRQLHCTGSCRSHRSQARTSERWPMGAHASQAV